MAINIQQELERLYSQNKTREASLSERLNAMDQYAGQVNPVVRSQMTDFSNRPAGYNPLQDIGAAIEFSERSRDYRTGASEDLGRTQSAGMDLLTQLDAIAQRQAAAASKQPEQTPEEKLAWEIKKAAAMEDIKQGRLKLNANGQLEVVKGKQVSDSTQEIIGVIDQLTNRNTKPITGLLQLEAMIPGTGAKLTESLYNQLKGMLSLENRQKLKGQGQISDFEFKVLGQAASALDRNMSDEDFRKLLADIRGKLSGEPQVETKPTTKTSGGKKKDPLGIL